MAANKDNKKKPVYVNPDKKEVYTIRLRPAVTAIAEGISMAKYRKGLRSAAEKIVMKELGITEKMVEEYIKTH